MSLFEWLGEAHNPGPVGTCDVGRRSRGNRPRFGVLVCFGVAALLLVLWAYLVLGVWQVWDAAGLAGILLATSAYLLLGYFVHPRPDPSNIGLLGGLIDHPFRYSDDINRSLILLAVLLWPGRFVSESLVDMAGLVAHAAKARPKDAEEKDPGPEVATADGPRD